MRRSAGLALSAAVLAGVAFFAGALVQTRSAVSADNKPTAQPHPIGYVELSRLMREYKRVQAQVERLNADRLKKTEEIGVLRKQFEARAKEIEGTKDQAERADLEREQLKLRQQIETMDSELNRDLNARASKILLALHKQISAVLKEVAAERGLAAVYAYPMYPETDDPKIAEVLLKPTALYPLYLDRALDVTDEVLKRLNDKFDKID
jgi:Skp family chaperone for outer membrane proteins